MRKYIILITAVLFAISCSKDNEAQELFVGQCGELGLSIGGSVVVDLSANKSQMSFSPDKKQFRVFDDNMSNYYILDVDALPGGVGSTFRADLTWTTSADVRRRSGVKFKVIREDKDLLWVWNKKDDIGLVIRMVRN